MSVDVTKLPSGLTVITDTMPHLETAALGVWAGVGGRDEKPDEHGISHLLEHMAFKGTTRRSSREIVEEIEAVGGDLNAGTSTETTAYYARVLEADVGLALDVIGDIVLNPAFDEKEIEVERHVILPLDLRQFGGSALTADILVPKDGLGDDIPVTYVPARNLIFLSLTLAWVDLGRIVPGIATARQRGVYLSAQVGF